MRDAADTTHMFSLLAVVKWPYYVHAFLAQGDGCGFIVQKRMADWVDGRQVLIEGEPLVRAPSGTRGWAWSVKEKTATNRSPKRRRHDMIH